MNPLLSFDGIHFGDRNLRSPHVGGIGPASGVLPGDQETDFYRFRLRRCGEEKWEGKKGKADDSQGKKTF
ncbi:MAG: hypothetical protein H6Q44_7 [Deltaproteobacteria bacterium]|nr:hypothetical protein [Deltaproteobacteria bacterium]